jgi:hypothetical protein
MVTRNILLLFCEHDVHISFEIYVFQKKKLLHIAYYLEHIRVFSVTYGRILQRGRASVEEWFYVTYDTDHCRSFVYREMKLQFE